MSTDFQLHSTPSRTMPAPMSYDICTTEHRDGKIKSYGARYVGYHSAPVSHDVNAENTLKDRALVMNARPTDYMVYSAARTLLGTVRKADGRVMWRKVTDSHGLGVWHIVRGVTKRMPKAELERVFGTGAYMVDAAHVIKVNRREDIAEIRDSAPRDRRPQQFEQNGRKPHKGASDFVPVASMWYYDTNR